MDQKHRILVIDDDLFPLTGHVKLLRSKGYEVETADTATSGLSIASAEKFRLILLDIVLPDLDGYEVCRHLKSGAEYNAPYIIMVTGEMTKPDDFIKGFEIGADDYISKPVNEAVLLARVNAAFRLIESELALLKAIAEINTLQGILPICSHCKSIRDDKNGGWHQLESYISNHSGADFSHSICPDCARKYYPDLNIYDE